MGARFLIVYFRCANGDVRPSDLTRAQGMLILGSAKAVSSKSRLYNVVDVSVHIPSGTEPRPRPKSHVKKGKLVKEKGRIYDTE
ncbi:hypothetical protein J6590_004867, partial [Homalodisca vitripennis]